LTAPFNNNSSRSYSSSRLSHQKERSHGEVAGEVVVKVVVKVVDEVVDEAVDEVVG
jgi:hypothetical protein